MTLAKNKPINNFIHRDEPFLHENSTVEKKRISRKRANKISRKRNSMSGGADSKKDAKSDNYAAMKRPFVRSANIKNLEKDSGMIYYLTLIAMSFLYVGNQVANWLLDFFKNLYHFGRITKLFSIFQNKTLSSIVIFVLLFIAAKSVKNLAISEMRDYTEKHDVQDQVVYDKQWAEYIQTFRTETEAANFKSKIYANLPWRFLSRTWGKVHKKRIPKCLRSLAYNTYIWMTGVTLEEAKNQDLTSYKNLNSFFRREIREELRPVASNDQTDLVSPVDGRVLSLGKISEEGMVKQVKGINYSVKTLLGPNNFVNLEKSVNDSGNFTELSSQKYVKSLLKDPVNNDLFYSVIYLAPGDYHRYHSPTEWTVNHRRHFPGACFVNVDS